MSSGRRVPSDATAGSNLRGRMGVVQWPQLQPGGDLRNRTFRSHDRRDVAVDCETCRPPPSTSNRTIRILDEGRGCGGESAGVRSAALQPRVAVVNDTTGTVPVPSAGHFQCSDINIRLFFHIKYTEAILSNSTRKLLWFEITKMQIAVNEKMACHLL